MHSTTEILHKLRKLLENPPNICTGQLAAYIVPTDDAHQSEYICKADERRAYITGFHGSAGTAVISMDAALLWTDGRYYQQAEKEMDSNWTLMKDALPSTPSIGFWLNKYLPSGSKVGVDPKLMAYRVWQPLQKELKSNENELVAVEENLVDMVWGSDRPKRTSYAVNSLNIAFAGATVGDKWAKIKAQLKDKRVEALVVSALDEIAWFLNLRGTDIDYNPVFFSYLIITNEDIILFIDSTKLPDNFEDHLSKNNVKITIYPYEEIGEKLKSIAENALNRVWISPVSSYFLTALIPKNKRYQEITPIALLKAIKNQTEIDGFIQCHIRDGLALCQYFAWLEARVAEKNYPDEISGAAKLEELRSKGMHYKGLSFPTINASGPNGSNIHYHPDEATNRKLTENEVYLCDSGTDGTTDVTRTMHLGVPTDFQMETYTRVLKGQLALGATVFPKKVKGQVLDTIARKVLWDVGLDYGHGTGHGVGHYLNVHEGPMGIGIRLMPDDPGLQENMLISNEPGYYKDGEFGIRIEDIVQIVPAKVAYDFAGRGALTFKTITMCPKQTKMIKKDLLTSLEIQQVNEYHRQVWETLSPFLKKEGDKETLAWLKKETVAI